MSTTVTANVSQPGKLTIEVPTDLLRRIVESETVDELEDWLLANDPEFIERMKQARRADLSVKTKPLS